MTRSLLLFSLLWLCCSSDCSSQYSSTQWKDAKLDTLSSGNSDEFNPALQKNSYFYGPATYSWLVFERHTTGSSDIAAKRFIPGGKWDTATVLIAASTPAAEQDRPRIAGFSRTPSNAVAAWQKKTGGVWNIYYAFYLADSVRWQRPQALTSDSIDCSDVRALANPDSSFIVSWKRKNVILFSILTPRSYSMPDTAAISNYDSLEYDLGNSGYTGKCPILFTKKDSTGRFALWEGTFWRQRNEH